MLRPDDIVEATERRETELGVIEPGDRHTVHQVSASGAFIRLHGSESFIRASGFKWVGVDVPPWVKE
ncbi:hypothetical protein [Phenylobacterium soli]|uniref:Uncharacterized protein n=1 Tax=Phenylobacterium soli TaxID=2170551 RepID=A0A328A9E2_9CAUL|nr:hypothetical protein [Phenylobacterium soli]RAK51201.1 hypothetical protein DJ017_19785 [Phenylobacterium soli]